MKKPFLCIGIETSCDETSAAVVRDGREILSNSTVTQIDLHKAFGGVVPEIACRAHIETILPVIDKALKDARVKPQELTAVSVTNRPGLIGALLVGISAAKAMAWALDKPIIGINHVHAHIYANHLLPRNHETAKDSALIVEPVYPYLGLIVSGGHTSLYWVKSPLQYKLLGRTLDDAAGEAFDKVAHIIRLGYPGGPSIEKAARKGNPAAIRFPRGLVKDGYDFSFSGIKTAVLYYCKGQNATRKSPLKKGIKIADVAASFQEAAVDTLIQRVTALAKDRKAKAIALGGGVAANQRLRDKLSRSATVLGIPVHIPPKYLCLDNGAMVAGLAYHYWKAGKVDDLYLDGYSQGDDVG
ncbi:MAG: tRNA (adenosine(37)-N6)-threonylcarbamoyltransferase complex transferase subunit TsaD [Candidatus Brocadiia bacterium]